MEMRNIVKTIDEIAQREPDRVVYDYLGQKNTYADLIKRANSWAALLKEKAPAKVPVMIWGGQTFDMLACFLGCVKSGHCYVPIADYSNAEKNRPGQRSLCLPGLDRHQRLAGSRPGRLDPA